MSLTISGISADFPKRQAQAIQLLVVAVLAAGCGLLFLKSWILGFGCLFAMGVAAFLLQYPSVAWGLTFAMYYVFANYVPPYLSSPLTWGVLLLFVLGYWSQHIEVRRPVYMGDRRLWWGIGIWLLWTVVCVSQAINPFMGAKEFVRYMLSFVVFATYFNWLRDREHVGRVVRYVEWLVFAVAVFYLVETLRLMHTGSSQVALIGHYPPTPSEFGTLFAAVIPISVSLWFSSPKRFSLSRMIYMGTLVTAVLLSSSRTACLAALVSLGWLLYAAYPRFIGGVAKLGAIAATGTLAWLWYQGVDVVSNMVYQLSGRDIVWRAALQAIEDHPVFGIGPGNWSLWFGRHFTSADFFMEDRHGNTFALAPDSLGGEAHNLFLTKAAEMGWLSAALIAVIIASWFVAARRCIAQTPSGWWRNLAIGSMASMWGLLAFCCFENGPIIGRARGGEVHLVWFIAVLPFIARRLSQREERENV